MNFCSKAYDGVLGDGSSIISCFSDPWIPSSTNFNPLTNSLLHQDLKVAYLILQPRLWNFQKLNQVFLEVDIDRICSTPQHSAYSRPHYISGEVWLFLASSSQNFASSFDSSLQQRWWKKFWSLSIPNKSGDLLLGEPIKRVYQLHLVSSKEKY